MTPTSFIVGLVLAFVGGVAVGHTMPWFSMAKLSDPVESISMMPVGGVAKPWGNEEIITIVYKSGLRKQYRGDCTVWHSYPEGERQSTSTESWLADIWQREKWKREKRA